MHIQTRSLFKCTKRGFLCIQRHIDALLTNFPMYKDIDGRGYVVPSLAYEKALEALKEELCVNIFSL